MRDIDPFKAPLHSVQLRGMYFICRFANMSSCHASNVVRKSSTLYQVLDCWTAPLRTFVLNPRSLWETEIAAEIAHNSRASFVFFMSKSFQIQGSSSVPMFLMLFVKFGVISKEK